MPDVFFFTFFVLLMATRLPGVIQNVVQLAAVAWLPLLALKSRILVHEDGVRVRFCGFTRFIPYTKIERARLVSRSRVLDSRRSRERMFWGVDFVLADGTSFQWGLVAEDNDSVGPSRLAEARELIYEIQRRAAIAERVRDPLVAELSRSERSATDWLRDLMARSRVEGNAYRSSAPLPSERLWEIAENPEALPSARAGAAVALRASLTEAGKARLRVASAACGSPTLRAAIAKVAEDSDEEELTEALSLIED